MTIVLTSYPLHDPDANEILDSLATIYWQQDQIIMFLRSAGLDPQLIDLVGAARLLWSRTLDQAARSGDLEALLGNVAADSESLALRPAIERLLKRLRAHAHSHAITDFDVFELAMLSPTRSFIGRPALRQNLKDFGMARGARVLVVQEEAQSGQVGRTHSWYLINEIGQRLQIYDSYRFNQSDWADAPQGPLDVMAEICGQLGWPMPPVAASEPPALVRLLVPHFKRLGRTLASRTCLVFDAYTIATADEWARALVVNIAAAANDGEAGNLCVALLEVDSKLPPGLARDAMPEHLQASCLKDLEDFFTAAAADAGLEVSSQDMPLLLERVLGPPPHPQELLLPVVGPRAAEVAASIFGGSR